MLAPDHHIHRGAWHNGLAMGPAPSGDMWALRADFRFGFGGEEWTIPKGRQSDGASVPNLPVFAWLVPRAHPRYSVATWVHDELLARHSQTVSRRKADRIFLAFMVIDGTRVWRAHLMWLAVRLYGTAKAVWRKVRG